MTATYETAPCPPGAICTPQGRDHVVSYEFGVDRASSPRKPFVVHGEIDGVDLCLDVKIKLEIRTQMAPPSGGFQRAKRAQVNLHPAIDLEPCSTYFRTESWLGAAAGVKARQETLHQFHEEIVKAFGGARALERWNNLKGVPANVTVVGAAIGDVRKYVNEKLAELGDVDTGDDGSVGSRSPRAGHRGHSGRAGKVGAGRRSRAVVITPAKRRGSLGRSEHRRRQTSKSKTPSRGR
jgi:hypothetical protein